MGQQCEELRYKEVSALLSSDVDARGYFGASVAIAGNRLVVGANYADTAGTDAGKVYVYDWNGTAYVEVTQLTASDAQAYDWFGSSVAISRDGKRLVVGARGADTTAVDAGKVYIYDWNDTKSTYVEVAQLTASDAQAYGSFGKSVAVSGNRLMVGVDGAYSIGVDTGKVYVYDWNGTAYVEVAQLTASDAQDTDRFGSSVAIDGDGTRLVVGADGHDHVGKVYVYDWNGTTSVYDEVAQLKACYAEDYDLFGSSVAIDGNRLVVGAQYDYTAGVKAGKIYIYDWNGAAYVKVAQLTASDAQDYDQFGSSVSLSGNRFVVGALCEDTVGVNTGKVHVYDLPADIE